MIERLVPDDLILVTRYLSCSQYMAILYRLAIATVLNIAWGRVPNT